MHFLVQVHLLLLSSWNPCGHAQFLCAYQTSGLRALYLCSRTLPSKPPSHPLVILILNDHPWTSRCVPASLLAATCHHSTERPKAQPEVQEAGTPTANSELRHKEHGSNSRCSKQRVEAQRAGWPLRTLCKRDKPITQKSIEISLHRDT